MKEIIIVSVRKKIFELKKKVVLIFQQAIVIIMFVKERQVIIDLGDQLFLAFQKANILKLIKTEILN